MAPIDATSTREGLSKRPGKYALLGVGAGLLFVGSCPVFAAGWEIASNVSLSEIYLANDGQALADQADTDYVTELAPSIALRREGRRAKFNALYRMQNLWYSKTDHFDNTYHQYSATLASELVREVLFVDLGATRTQRIIDPNNVVTFDNLTTTSNRTDVDTLSFRPSYRHQFGSFATAEIGGSFDQVRYSDSNIADSDNVGYYASLASDDDARRIRWVGSFRRLEFLQKDNADDEYYQSILLDAGYQIDKRLTLIGGVGYESSNIRQSAVGESGGNWKLGAKWEPTPRTAITGTVGERFFGRSAFFQLQHQQKKTQYQLSYIENITHVSQLALGTNVFDPGAGGQDDSAIVDSGDPKPTEVINTPSITTGLFLSKRWSANYLKRTHRSRLNVRGFYEDRELAVGDDSEKVYGAGASWAWAVGNLTTSTISGDWQRQQLVASGKEDDDIWSARFDVSHKFGRRIVGTVSARKVKRDSPSTLLNYEQDQVSATLVLGL